jgi:hypothetical protein
MRGFIRRRGGLLAAAALLFVVGGATVTTAQNLITSADIKDGAVKTVDLANGAVNSAKIADGQVKTADLANNAVNSAKIADGQVKTADLANNAVNSAKIADGQVKTADLANNAVNSAKIADGQVKSADLANGGVANADLANNAVNSAKVADNSITSADIANGTIAIGDISQAAQDTLQSGGDTVVSALGGAWSSTGTLVSMTPDGVAFGPYADGGAASGSLNYSGLNGMTLADVENLVYYARYTASNDTGGVGVPYLRIFLLDEGLNSHRAIFSPNTQAPDPDVAEGPFHEWVATSGSWRYDDDAGNFPDISFAELLADHGTETITGLRITTGFTAGTSLSALLRWLEVNGQTFSFGS